MNFRIAGTFTDSLARLTGDEQKAVKTTAFDLQMNPANPGMKFHRVDGAKDKRFWSVRVNRDIRLIVHRTDGSLLLCYVGHHDDAYAWAERRKLETHPRTGAAQIVQIRETVQEVFVPVYVEEERPAPKKPALFGDASDESLLKYGVPEEWLADVKAANEDTILELADHLPEEAAEALLELATGGKPTEIPATWETKDPFEHPDARRRFRIMANVEELERAFNYPWEKWTLFLHPTQREIVERDYNGPVRVSGTAGTGKTIVALHRAVYLARKHPESRILLTTFSDTLARALRVKLRRLISNEPSIAERLEVEGMADVGRRLYERAVGKVELADTEAIRAMIDLATAAEPEHGFSLSFLFGEWTHVVDAWQIDSWESYRDVKRLGRKTRLPEAKREQLWKIFENVRDQLAATGKLTEAAMFTRLADALAASKHPPYYFAVIDEAQDLSVPQMRFLAALGKERSQSLFFAGDLGQRIFQMPFSWKSLGVDIRGRAKILRVNYRTSHQIRMQADRLLDPEIADVDGNSERRTDTVSVFNGPAPEIRVHETQEEEIQEVGRWLKDCLEEGIRPSEIGVFVRSEEEIARGKAAIEAAGGIAQVLTEKFESQTGKISLCTMHLGKGLEFRAVAVMACDDEVIPSQTRIEEMGDTADLHEVYNTERHLLYVACTRARDRLLVTATDPESEFLADMAEVRR